MAAPNDPTIWVRLDISIEMLGQPYLDCDCSHGICVSLNFVENGRMAESENWSSQQPLQAHTGHGLMQSRLDISIEMLGQPHLDCYCSHGICVSLNFVESGRMAESKNWSSQQPLQLEVKRRPLENHIKKVQQNVSVSMRGALVDCFILQTKGSMSWSS
ncbi:hypothetical protein Tco_1198645 [Tanacetum coccineum]